jgi:hypothetical protein
LEHRLAKGPWIKNEVSCPNFRRCQRRTQSADRTSGDKRHGPLHSLEEAVRSPRKGQTNRVTIYENESPKSGEHAIANGISVERHEIPQFEPACVGFIHLGDTGDLVLGEVVPVIVARNFEESPGRSFHML